MTIVHLAASAFFGGPERQMLGLARHLPDRYSSVFLSFAEGGRCQPFLEQLQEHGIPSMALENNTPHFIQAAREIAIHLNHVRADVFCCHGYKADVLGYFAARHTGVPIVSVSRGWTGVTGKVRFYESLDKLLLSRMDRVVCVSEGQAAKVRRAGVPTERVVVIRNAIQPERFAHPAVQYRRLLHSFFPRPPRRIIGAAGRLSVEKGFGQLVEAAQAVVKADPAAGFVLFGEGPLRHALERQIVARGLREHFILAGFRSDVDSFIPHLDLVVLPSFTEGLPNIALEAFAAGVPVVATAVGGTPEVVTDGISGYLVPPGDPPALAARILDMLRNDTARQMMGQRGRQHVQEHFTFEAQSTHYQQLFEQLASPARHALSPVAQVPL